jgi:hypothetical protein
MVAYSANALQYSRRGAGIDSQKAYEPIVLICAMRLHGHAFLSVQKWPSQASVKSCIRRFVCCMVSCGHQMRKIALDLSTSHHATRKWLKDLLPIFRARAGPDRNRPLV